jgi:hypothetical protein
VHNNLTIIKINDCQIYEDFWLELIHVAWQLLFKVVEQLRAMQFKIL